jgi:hypothetical protein
MTRFDVSHFEIVDVRDPRSTIECAKKFSHEVVSRVAAIVAVAGGGSFFKPDGRADSHSDLDIYGFSEVPPKELFEEVASILPGARIDVRPRLLAASLSSKHLIVDFKVFSIRDYERLLEVKPNLDQQYLEDLENLHNLELLSDSNGRLTSLISRSLEYRKETIEQLQLQLHEVYAKACFWTVVQGIRRGLSDTGDYLFHQACESLIQLCYLDAGILPPSIKWRATHRLDDHSLAEPIFGLMSNSNVPLLERLKELEHFEDLVSAGSSKAPWCAHDSRWWWLEEVTGQAQ